VASLRALLKLCRIEYAGFGYVAALGGLAERGADLPFAQLVALLAANQLFGFWTFAHNDVCDLEVDRKVAGLEERVLVRGDLSPRFARILIVVLGIAMLAVSQIWLGGAATLAFAAASAFALAYDAISKRVIGADLLFGASAACLPLAGAFAANGGATISPLALLVVASVFLEHVFFNAIEGGLKDIVGDRQAGARTFAQRYVRVDGDAIDTRGVFGITAHLLKGSSVALVLVTLALREPIDAVQLAVFGALGIIASVFTARLLAHRRFDWFRMAHELMPIEMASRAFVPVFLADRIGWGVAALLCVVPALWFVGFSKLVHSRGFALPKRF
jgi:4-hydroxybenzoate polyprenyltransferase